jgi:hypothetical protein
MSSNIFSVVRRRIYFLHRFIDILIYAGLETAEVYYKLQ